MKMDEKYYRTYSNYLKNTYGEKVYKLPINLPVTCPNRDGNLGRGGCIYCGDEGAGYECLDNKTSVKEQLEKNKNYISQKYKAHLFVAYFQNFSNTYMPFDSFKNYIEECDEKDIIEVSISTRPDCISERQLDFLKAFSEKTGKAISIELGLQSVNPHTLEMINRGHSLGEFIDAVMQIKQRGFKICTHLILDLPWDDRTDVIEAAKILSALKIDFIKLHALYVVKNTKIAKLYEEKKFTLIEKDEYINRTVIFLEYLSEDTVIQRLIGRAPEENTVTANWNTSWWKIKDEILEKMEAEGTVQGSKCNYLSGKALKNKSW